MASGRSSQRETIDRIRTVREVRWWSAEVVSAIRIVSVSLDLLRWNEDEFSILPALCVNITINEFDFCWITVCVIAAAGGWAIWHMPIRIEFLVQSHILWRVMTRNRLLSRLLRAKHLHREQATDANTQQRPISNSQGCSPDACGTATRFNRPVSSSKMSQSLRGPVTGTPPSPRTTAPRPATCSI